MTKVKSMGLSWVTTKNFDEAIAFFEKIGLTLDECDQEYGWAELSCTEGKHRLGICKESEESEKMGVKAGDNAIITFTVDDIVGATETVKQAGAQILGPMIDCPEGKVKLQTIRGPDSNLYQLVELYKE